MIYDNHIPDSPINVQVFHAQGSSTDWYSWNKPHNCKFIHIFCLGSGGGGGGGQGSSTGTARRGGGGGGSGAYVSGFYSAAFLPDTLYLQVASGGTPGTGGSSVSAGGAGRLSYVSIQPNTTAANIILQSGSVVALGGGAGNVTGAAGAGGTVWTAAATNILLTGLIVPVAGQIGIAGETTSPADPRSISGVVTGGAAGAGMNGGTAQQGGSITGTGSVSTIEGGLAGGSATSTTAGSAGSSYLTTYPSSTNYVATNLFFSGGSGGGSSDGGAGGEGGAAAFGSGGGGGGAGFTNLGGSGGKGGNGLIIITCF